MFSRSIRRVWAAVFVPALIASAGTPLSGSTTEEAPDQAIAGEMISLGLRGVHFVPNHGQWEDDSIYYGFRSRGLDVAFRESKLTMHLRRERTAVTSRGTTSAAATNRDREEAALAAGANSPESLPHGRGSFNHRSPEEPIEWETLQLSVTFPGSNPIIPAGAKPQTARFNYYVGDDESTWASDVPSYGEIIYEDLYDGIDLHVMGSDDGVLKYEFHCDPGADHTQIRIHYGGIDGLCVDERSGDLLIETAFGTLRDGAPLVWQSDPRLTLPARFEILDRRIYTIFLDSTPDPSQPLVIDPEIDWMYYFGGSDNEFGNGIAVDGDGNAFLTGDTQSPDFAGRNNSYYGGVWDAFVLKTSPSGQLEWMTYLGGDSYYNDYGHDIALDSSGNALVSGVTGAADFPGRNNSFYGGTHDSFLLKISPAGQLEWMTYLGGSGRDAGYYGGDNGIAVDGADNAFVCGTTESSDFAGRNNAYYGDADAFTLKVSPSGELLWMTYLGGGGDEQAHDLAVDGVGDAIVTGHTYSTDFAGRTNRFHGRQDAFALKTSSSGDLQWMTYFGGGDLDSGRAVAVDDVGNALVTGDTDSSDFAGRNNRYGLGEDAFALKVSRLGGLKWMTYLGGWGRDSGRGVALDGAGNALVTGITSSPNFAGRSNSYYGGTFDSLLLQVSSTGQLQWMTYLGGSGEDYGSGVAVGYAGNALIAGHASSPDFNGLNNSIYGREDAYLLSLRLPDDGPRLRVDPTSCSSGGPIRIQWTGATPGGQVAVLYSPDVGSSHIPGGHPCAGTQLGLDINQVQVVFHGDAGATGRRTINGNAPPGVCGGWMQLLDLATCATSLRAAVE